MRHWQSGHAAGSLLHDDFDASQEREAASSLKRGGSFTLLTTKLNGTDTGMKFHTEYLTFNTKKHREYIHITPQVEEALRKSGIQEGMVLVSAMHITAGVYVNDNESGLIHDIDKWLEELAPYRDDYEHHQTGETNGDSHLKSMLVHHE